ALWTDRNPEPTIAPLVRDIDLLIGNAIAVRAMLRVHVTPADIASPDSARAFARGLAEAFGVRRVALTRREIISETRHTWGASIYDTRTGAFAHSRTRDVQVVDRVGGGDSFAAALIA